MHRHHAVGAGGELDFGHALEGPAHAVPGIGRNRVVEHWRAIAAQLHLATDAVRVKTVAQQGEHHVGVRQLRHAQGVFLAEAAQQGAGQRRVQGRYFKLVAHRPADAVAPLEMVGVDRLRCAVERVDRLLEQPGAEVDQVQEGALAQAFMRVRGVRAQQQAGAIDAAAGEDVMPGLDPDLPAGGFDAA
ncbi:hypothetical protein D3C79_840660 [compost metagenome]